MKCSVTKRYSGCRQHWARCQWPAMHLSSILYSSTVFWCLNSSFLSRELQRDVVYLGWPIAPSNMNINGGEGGLRGLSQWVHLYTRSPNKLWRSNSILFNLCFSLIQKCCQPLGILWWRNRDGRTHLYLEDKCMAKSVSSMTFFPSQPCTHCLSVHLVTQPIPTPWQYCTFLNAQCIQVCTCISGLYVFKIIQSWNIINRNERTIMFKISANI